MKHNLNISIDNVNSCPNEGQSKKAVTIKVDGFPADKLDVSFTCVDCSNCGENAEQNSTHCNSKGDLR